MTSVGETLRRERLRRNLDLEAVSRDLKISPRMLDAIEAEKFDRLPGGVFAKSFVRQYAHFLGLDEEELAGEVQKILGPPPDDLPRFAAAEKVDATIPLPRVQAWEAVGDRRFSWGSPLPALALVVVVIMGCSGVYAWWQRTRHPVLASTAGATHKPAPAVPVQAAAQQTAAAQTAPPAATPAQGPVAQSPQPTADRIETPSVPTVAQKPVAPVEQKEASVVPAPAAAPPANAPPPQASLPSNPNAPVRVEITAAEPVWVLVRSDGKYLFSGTLDANQTRTVEANSNVSLRLGNAGGVTVTLNGKPIGSVGPKGQVRTVNLTSTGFQVIAPKPEAPTDPTGHL